MDKWNETPNANSDVYFRRIKQLHSRFSNRTNSQLTCTNSTEMTGKN